MMDLLKWKRLGIFAGGVLFGTVGVKILASEDAKKVYTNCVAAGLRVRNCAVTTAASIQENADDILAEAKEINRQRGYEGFDGDDISSSDANGEEKASMNVQQTEN